MPTEETLVLVKPDGVARGLTGAILARIEAKGYSLVDIKLVEPDRDVLERHYAEHAGKPFYEPLVEFMLSGPSVAIPLPPTNRTGCSTSRPTCRSRPPRKFRNSSSAPPNSTAITRAGSSPRSRCGPSTRARRANPSSSSSPDG